MDLLTLLYIFSVYFAGLTKGNNVLPAGPLNAAEGRNVTFTTTLDPTPTPFQSILWTAEKGGLIVTSTNAGTTVMPAYKDRITLYPSTGSLELRNVSLDDSGLYRVNIINQAGVVFFGERTLNVQIPVSNVTITTTSTDLMEFSSVRLSCSSSGSSLSFHWLNDSSKVTPGDRVQITDGGSTMTIVSVTRYDQGPFKCNVSNLVSDGTSDPVKFNISYGPENVTLTVSPSQNYHPEGSNVTLSCSATSEPTAEFTWLLNGLLQPDTGPELRLMNIQMHHKGNYSCRASNSKTMRNETSQPLFISVLKNISNVSVNSSTALPIEGQSFNLTCGASGSVFTTEWMKDGLNLSSTDNIIFYDNNRVLSFKNLSRRDSGKYICRVTNPLSSDTSTYDLIVNFGPENVKIEVLSEVCVGKPLKLRCSAKSTPTAAFTWKHNGTDIHSSSEYTKDSAEFSDSGEYICQATNNITEKMDFTMHKLEVTDIPADGGSSCDTGCIVGIVFGCLVIILLVATLVLVIMKKKYLMEKFSKGTSNRTEGEGQDNSAYTRNQELNYVDVRFIHNRNGGTVELGQQKEVSEYAEVRVNNTPSSLPTYDAHMERTKRPAPQPDDNDPQYAQVRKK